MAFEADCGVSTVLEAFRVASTSWFPVSGGIPGDRATCVLLEDPGGRHVCHPYRENDTS